MYICRERLSRHLDWEQLHAKVAFIFLQLYMHADNHQRYIFVTVVVTQQHAVDHLTVHPEEMIHSSQLPRDHLRP